MRLEYGGVFLFYLIQYGLIFLAAIAGVKSIFVDKQKSNPLTITAATIPFSLITQKSVI